MGTSRARGCVGREGRRALASALVALGLSTGAAGAEETLAQLYSTRCQPCHGAGGNSPNPDMNLADGRWIHGSKLADMVKVIENGVPGKAMLGFKELLTREQIDALARHVQSFGKKSKGGKAKSSS